MGKFAQRFYSAAALEAWLERLLVPWERDFRGETLAEGRALYRSGGVRSLELTEDYAVVGLKTEDRIEVFATVEWVAGRLAYRHSTPDASLGEALTVAGLYELEELVADEVTPLPALEAVAADGVASLRAFETQPAQPPSAVVQPAAPPEPTRRLRVVIDLTPRGVRLRANWRGGEGPLNAFTERPRNATERGLLIRLTGAARRAHFHYREATADYLLDDVAKIAPFVENVLPKWREHFEVAIDADVKVLANGVQEVVPELTVESGRDSGARIRMGFTLGGQALPEPIAARLAAVPEEIFLLPGTGLLRVRGGARTTVEDWRELLGHRLEREVPRYMLFSFLSEPGEVPVKLSSELEKWRGSLKRVNGVRPDSLPAFLRAYQKAGVEWMDRLASYGCHGLLADEMGLGKTLQVLALLHRTWNRDAPVLIVCPASVLPVWQAEIRRFFPELSSRILDKANSWRGEPSGQVWLASYSQLRRRRRELEGARFAYAVLDEAQSIKNPEAKVTQACMAIEAERRLALTGTPVENRHTDLWTVFRFLMPGLLGSRRSFERRLVLRPAETTRQLARQVSPFMLRRTKRVVAAELPDKVEMPLWCPLSQTQARAYRRVAQTGLLEFGGVALREQAGARRMGVLTLLTRLRQICCDPSLVAPLGIGPGHSGKLDALLPKLVEVVAGGHKAVVFSQFTSFLARARSAIESALPGVPLYELTGRTRDRAAPVQAFQVSAEPGVFLLSLRAGGVGITLHSAEYVFLLDPWWNPAVEAQAIDRVHRIGQSQTVFIYRLVSRGTVEERIEELKSSKRALFDNIVGGDRAWENLEAHFADLAALIEYDGGEEE